MVGTRKKWFLIWLGGFLFTLVLLFLLRNQVMRMMGSHLIEEDDLHKTTYAFVLGGGSFDRGNAAAELYHEGVAEKLVCLGENVPTILQAMDINQAESECARRNIIHNGNVPAGDVLLLRKGTSTLEEIEAIIAYCGENNATEAIILSDKFHTNRIRFIIDDLFPDNTVDFMLYGSESSTYDYREWWKSEEGLLMVNNEYVKSVYYWLKY